MLSNVFVLTVRLIIVKYTVGMVFANPSVFLRDRLGLNFRGCIDIRFLFDIPDSFISILKLSWKFVAIRIMEGYRESRGRVTFLNLALVVI
jgi:hypothetical protein